MAEYKGKLEVWWNTEIIPTSKYTTGREMRTAYCLPSFNMHVFVYICWYTLIYTNIQN